ncbi:MAG: lipopolysaccharide heptosyltransferase II [Gammaproteobacteria bacterium]|nr:lipopolysaccharide heptosyltransferase II [Gammaproteobacteria bacterium]MCW8840746.1 lipopolysaccharide heptosyltransferase II [Gammaproteobacteria bacterium]MCW8928352.1 lipopolysaccharide heptosyltransferase II [Gammaproteobacteria bacterium]MCW8959527.1 lipopolysaccharide heptosyltransferase II [Gammaproteobacteria bacterium]MCW8971765.1 lipopolysaccharide heptosyltransferase II [Gammaproteobacteria bacterium]
MNGTKRYLIAGPAWVGDMVMAQSLFMTIKQREPAAQIDVLAPAWSVPLLERMPEVHAAITVPIAHGEAGLAKRWRLGRKLRQNRYDQAIVIPRSLKAALIPFFAAARIRTGYRGELRYGLLNDMRMLDKSVLRQTVQRYVALALPDNAPLPPPIPQPKLVVDEANQQRLSDALGLDRGSKVIGLMPGAEYGPAKCWPLDYYAGLARGLVEAGHQVWIFGSEKDRAAGEVIVEGGGEQVHNLCGRTTLVEAVDLIAACDAVVSNDSGLMHVAAATGRPLVAIYGSSTPDYTPPLSGKAEVLYRRLECSPCFERHCPLGHTDCLTGITVKQVHAALMPRLESNQ